MKEKGVNVRVFRFPLLSLKYFQLIAFQIWIKKKKSENHNLTKYSHKCDVQM